MIDQEYEFIGNSSIRRKFMSKKRKRIRFLICIIVITILIITSLKFLFNNNNEHYELMFIKGETRKDKYGIDLNANILDGAYCIGYQNDVNMKFEDWNLYTPPCPNLQPVHYPDNIKNPVCEDSSIQILNYDNNKEFEDLPKSLHLNSITNQMKKWKEWLKTNGTNPFYGYKFGNELVDDIYYPFDYGYNGPDTSKMDDVEYYTKVVNSRMDEVPDPRRRRLFSFILFNTEFDLLDIYLSEYYEIFDYFVIFESNTTFSGNPKSLFFTRTLLETDRYDKFKDKLIPLPCYGFIEDKENDEDSVAFQKEFIARRTLIEKGLRSVHARHGDIIIHGDLDEFPKTHLLFRLKKCGGWEHLQAGIGGGPKSFKDKNVESYLIPNNHKKDNGNKKDNNDDNNDDDDNDNDNDNDVETTTDGRYKIDYEKEISLNFVCHHYQYSFNCVDDETFNHPNIAIFDARRALGQYPVFENRKTEDIEKREDSPYDPLTDPNFDPYTGYTYSNSKSTDKSGKGFISEYLRYNFLTNDTDAENRRKVLFWESGIHLSSSLPTLEHIYNKISSYSHFDSFTIYVFKFIKMKVISYRIKKHAYIFGSFKSFKENIWKLPESYSEGYKYNFNYNYWKKMTSNNGTDPDFKNYVEVIKHELPSQIWKNPICYSYMLDRDFGMNKKLWWEVIPKKQWKTVQFDKLDPSTIDKILPKNITGTFKNEMLISVSN